MTPEDTLRLRRELAAIRHQIEELCRAIQEYSGVVHSTQEGQQQPREARNPARVVVSLDKQMAYDTKAQDDRQYKTQDSIRKWTRAAVIAAVIYAAVAGLQWNEMRKATITQKNTIVLEERAWLGVIRFTSSLAEQPEVPYVQAGKEVRFVAQFTNTGKTPGKAISTVIAFNFLPKETEVAPESMQPNPFTVQSTMVVQPGAIHFIQTLPTTFSAENILEATSGTKVLYVYGRIVYLDIFGNERHTEFCALLDQDLEAWTSCARYNNAD